MALLHGGSPSPQEGIPEAPAGAAPQAPAAAGQAAPAKGQQPGTPNLNLNLAPGGELSNNN
ncbi:MAG: hypothetical protein U1E17_18350 [Geminicoccaceae bacterium]